MNFIDYLILVLIAAAVGFAIHSMIKNKKKNKGCCGGCSGCKYNESCQSKKDK